jgi:hypothetical protein
MHSLALKMYIYRQNHINTFLKNEILGALIDMTPERSCSNNVVQTNLVYDKYGIDRIINVEVNGK